MLNNETKRRIDTARDILVGKVPDPKSQVEQITIALIYKFMDDMDKESLDWGGVATFFAGDYEKYSWTKIFNPNIGSVEMLNLYGEAIVELNHNPNIPQLFRDIFKNAYLPYRDPETLKLFLKTINEFRYDHSEMLGDAFEYLLSVLGSQGDAGQFRTPRHIIDFMVELLAPQKGESICDPACGTAGFLVAAYKYILAHNTQKQKGDLLTPDDRNAMMRNFKGYDISPDMVRLSLVNLYLHGFSDPHIKEYDTLTSEDNWNEYFDIILANPPFMTPKGGIKPHKKFSIQASKSEVLFTDYIAEHINPIKGRAAIIVPNGVVATTQTAYKQLRKLLVEQSLIAVISLPAGVFQPYSGVKTSILLLDRSLSKKSKHILFLKVNNDGYDLGAQRRAIDKNDLPTVVATFEAYKAALQKGVGIEEMDLGKGVLLVEKEKVLGNKDVVLSGERYVEGKAALTEFEMVKLEDVCIIQSGGTPSKTEKSYWENGTIPWVGSAACKNQIIYNSDTFITESGLKNSNTKLFPKGTTLIALVGATIGKTAYLEFETCTNQNIAGLQVKDNRLDKKYLYLACQTLYNKFYELGEGGFSMASLSFVKNLEIPLPPLEVQQQIVAEIEGYQAEILALKEQIKEKEAKIQARIAAVWVAEG